MKNFYIINNKGEKVLFLRPALDELYEKRRKLDSSENSEYIKIIEEEKRISKEYHQTQIFNCFEEDPCSEEKSTMWCECGSDDFKVCWRDYDYTGGFCKITCSKCGNSTILINDMA